MIDSSPVLPSIILQPSDSQPAEFFEPHEKPLSAHDLLDIDEAISIFSRKVKENCHLIDEYIELGRLFRKRKEFQKSFILLRNLLVRDDLRREQQSRVYAELGYNYLFSKSKDHGEAYFLQALKNNKESFYVLDGLYQCLRQTKQLEKAAETLRGIVKTFPNRKSDLVILLSETALQKAKEGQMSQAKKALGQAQDIKTESPFLQLAQAQIQTMDQKRKEAIQTLEEFIEKWPTYTLFALKKIENLYYEMNQYSRYSYTLTKCIQKNPQNFYAHHALGKYLIKIKRVDEALEHFEKAIDLCPFSIHSLKEIVKLYMSKDDPDGVLRILETFVASPQNQRAIACPRCHGINSNHDCPICSPVITPDIHRNIRY